MARAKALLYRFRGCILGVMALALFLLPASPFPESLDSENWMLYIMPWSMTALFYLVGVSLRIFSRRYIGEHTRGNVHDAETLVTSGPYSCVRHPLYLSNFMIANGVVFFHLGLSLWVLPFVLLVASFEVSLSRMEDSFLEARFGDEWRNWAEVTPAFWPRVSGRFPSNGANSEKRPIWRAFMADASTWMWLAIVNFLLVMLKFLWAAQK